MGQLHHTKPPNRGLNITSLKAQALLFLLIIFFLPTQYGLHLWPDFSLVAGKRMDYLSPTVFFTDILIGLLLSISFVSWFFSYRKTRILIRQLFVRIFDFVNGNKLLVALFISITVGILFSSRPILGIYSLLRLIELILFALVSYRLFESKAVRMYFIAAFSISMLLQSVLAIWQFNSQSSIGGIFYYLGERTFSSITPGIANASLGGALILRPYGTLPHPNVLGGYLLLGLILVCSEFLTFRISRNTGMTLPSGLFSKIKKVYLFTVMVFSSITLLLSMSRSAIAVGAALVIFLLVRALGFPRKQKVKKSMAKALNIKYYSYALFLLCIFLIVFSPIVSRFTSFSVNSESFVERKDLAIASFQMFLDHPLFGVGLGNFLVKLPEYVSLHKTPLQPVHNIYLLILAELGVVGAIIVSAFLVKIFKKAKDLVSFGNNRWLLLVVIMLLGFVDHYFLTLQQGRMLFALVIALILPKGQDFRPKRSKI
jgi:O-antigen ligase